MALSGLDLKKKQLELARVKLAKDELDLKIAEREEEINKLKEAILKQDLRISELQIELQ